MIKSSNKQRSIIVIAHNLRSSHNVGSLFRTCEGLDINELILSGYTPYPRSHNDNRLPHIISKLDAQIAKTALDAQHSINWRHIEDLEVKIKHLRSSGYLIYGLEQNKSSVDILATKPSEKMVIILGNELDGLDKATLSLCDHLIEIPMLGSKESFNVVQAAAMALFYFRFIL